ncbi:MAG: cobalt-precorrin-4 C(11)-methyltransferase [Kutzneria sp.]|nr:cobalt-precorrin-4 C(11)-methyltransferase [Kutzneria sp.]
MNAGAQLAEAGEPLCGSVRTGLVSFVGAGPGAADLITLRGARRLAEADVVIWAPGLVDAECVREHVRADAELIDCSRVGADEIVELFRRAARDRLRVARLCPGDPSMWDAVREQYDACRRIGVEAEVVPGVLAVSAAAAAVGRSLTGADQSMIVTKVDGTALPDSTRIQRFASQGATMAVVMAAARTAQLVEELTEGGYAEDTPVLVAHKTSWSDELLMQTTLGELVGVVKQHKLWRHTLFLVGKAMGASGRPRYRRSEPAVVQEDAAGSSATAEVPAARAPRRTAWSARAGRSSRIAATRAQQPQPVSQAAWRAVHGWQDATRSASPAAAAAAITRPATKSVATARVSDASRTRPSLSTAKKADASGPQEARQPAADTNEAKVSPGTSAGRQKPAAGKVVAKSATAKPGTGKSAGRQQSTKPRANQARRTRKSG